MLKRSGELVAWRCGRMGASELGGGDLEPEVTEVFPSGRSGGLTFLAGEFKELVPEASKVAGDPLWVSKERADQGQPLLLEELGHFAEAHLALIKVQGGGIGMLLPDKGQQCVQ